MITKGIYGWEWKIRLGRYEFTFGCLDYKKVGAFEVPEFKRKVNQ